MDQASLLLSSSERFTKELKAFKEENDALKEIAKLLSEKDQRWERKVQLLEAQQKELQDNFTLDLAEKQRGWETQQTQLQIRVNHLTWHIRDRDAVILGLRKEQHDKDAVILDLRQEQRDKDAVILDLQQEQHDKDAVIFGLFQEKKSLNEKLVETRTELLSSADELQQREDAWQAKYKALEDNVTKVLTEKDQIWKTKVSQLEDVNKDLTDREQSLETTVQQMEVEKKLLEDICLKMKKKMRGVFSRRRTEDRETTLRKMKKEETEREGVEKKEKKKGCFRWMHRFFLKLGGNSQVEEAAAQVGYQQIPLPPPFALPSSLHPYLPLSTSPSSSTSSPSLHPYIPLQ